VSFVPGKMDVRAVVLLLGDTMTGMFILLYHFLMSHGPPSIASIASLPWADVQLVMCTGMGNLCGFYPRAQQV
jgi:hypothetical protein